MDRSVHMSQACAEDTQEMTEVAGDRQQPEEPPKGKSYQGQLLLSSALRWDSGRLPLVALARGRPDQV